MKEIAESFGFNTQTCPNCGEIDSFRPSNDISVDMDFRGETIKMDHLTGTKCSKCGFSSLSSDSYDKFEQKCDKVERRALRRSIEEKRINCAIAIIEDLIPSSVDINDICHQLEGGTPTPLTNIAENTRINHINVAKTAKLMENLGIMKKVTVPHHRDSPMYSLTQTGEEFTRLLKRQQWLIA